jgi:dTMP kinase
MTVSARGKFITVEGIEGVGKSTNIEFIRSILEAEDKKVVVTREPGGTPIAEEIRTLLLDHRNNYLAKDSELLLMFAARAEHLAQVIRPALEEGKFVLCDRFTDATYAYQGGGRGISFKCIGMLEDWVQGELRPDLTLLLDVPVSIGMRRAGQRGQADRFEQEHHGFFERVRETYMTLAKCESDRIRIIDASKPLEAVHEQIRNVVTMFLQGI